MTASEVEDIRDRPPEAQDGAAVTPIKGARSRTHSQSSGGESQPQPATIVDEHGREITVDSLNDKSKKLPEQSWR